jgi:hypothetical protein
MEKERQAESQAICDAASEGPWTPADVLHLALAADVEFAAHARTALPEALAHIVVLERALADLAEGVSSGEESLADQLGSGNWREP